MMDKTDHRYTRFSQIADKLVVDLSTGLLMISSTDKLQVILPDSLRRHYLHSAHDTLAHSGITRVKQHLSQFYWLGKDKDIADYVNSCSLCSAKKGNYGKNAPKYGHNMAVQCHPWPLYGHI